jgi:ribonuclease P protein component
MRKDRRLRKSREFAAVRREGKSWSDRLLVLIALPNDMDITRFGFSVGKRIGNAVARNRVKRRLREAARLTEIQEGWDLVVIARKEASSADFHRLRSSMTRLFKRAGVLANSPEIQGCRPKVKQCGN